jgi:hypothetical protein
MEDIRMKKKTPKSVVEIREERKPPIPLLPPIEPMEIRLTVGGGFVQCQERGSGVPADLVLTTCDYDTDGQDEAACFLDEEGGRLSFEEVER